MDIWNYILANHNEFIVNIIAGLVGAAIIAIISWAVRKIKKSKNSVKFILIVALVILVIFAFMYKEKAWDFIGKYYFYIMSVLALGLILSLLWEKIEAGKIGKAVWKGTIIALLVIIAPVPFMNGTLNMESLLQRANDFKQTVTQKFTEPIPEIQDEKSEPVQQVTVTPKTTATFTPKPTVTYTPKPTKSMARALPSSPYPNEIPDSWDEIIASIDDGSAQQRYAIGAYKPLNLGRYGTVNMQLAGFDLDDRADGKGKASTTWIAKEVLPEKHRWNPNYDNGKEGTGTIGGWEKCELRQWMNGTLLSAIPENVRDRLVSVKKSQPSYATQYNYVVQKTNDRIWIPSYDEVFGDQSLYYGLFQNQRDRRVKTRDGSAAWWWLRSVGNNYSANYANINGSYSNIYVNNISGGVVVGFCLDRDVPTALQEGEISDSWDEIITAIDNGTAQQRYAVGAYKPLDLGEFGTVNMQLAGFNLDDRADGKGKASTTWIAREILPEMHRWNPSYDDGKEGTGAIGGWEKCELRQWMNGTLLSAIHENVRDRLVSVKKSQPSYATRYDSVVQKTNDRIWIPSYDEIFGDQSLYYGLFQNQRDRRVKTRDGSVAWWWLRSVGNNYSANYANINGSYSNIYVTNTSGGVVVGFCL